MDAGTQKLKFLEPSNALSKAMNAAIRSARLKRENIDHVSLSFTAMDTLTRSYGGDEKYLHWLTLGVPWHSKENQTQLYVLVLQK